MTELFKAEDCGIEFGGLRALHEITFSLQGGELLGLIGPNGAGKTTFFNLITGVYQPTVGSIDFAGHSLLNLKPYEISRRGVARTFQNIRLFAELTVEDNVLVAYHRHVTSSLLSGVLRGRRYVNEEKLFREKASEILRIFDLEGVKGEMARNLPYGHQRRLEIVRALATGPKLLLLDEPAAGMNATEKNHLIDLIHQVREKFGVAILLIEHDMSVVMTLCPRIIVLDYGEIIAEGTPDEIRKNPRVIEAYLGKA